MSFEIWKVDHHPRRRRAAFTYPYIHLLILHLPLPLDGLVTPPGLAIGIYPNYALYTFRPFPHRHFSPRPSLCILSLRYDLFIYLYLFTLVVSRACHTGNKALLAEK